MGVNLNHDSGDDVAENADMNITPFIDVILVLLIIFMVAAPLSTVDIAIELPTSAAKQQQRPDHPVFVTIKSDLSVAVGEDMTPRDSLAAKISAETRDNKDERLFLRADKGVTYGDLMSVMNILRRAGYLKVALVGLEDAAPAGSEP